MGNMNSDYLTEWQYRYNPFKEREQKRLYYTNKGDQNGSFYPWAYYLLGLSREQYAVYNGIQMIDDVYKGIAVAGGGVQDCYAPSVGRNVYIFPTEYNVYSLGSGFNLSYKADENGQWQKHFKVKDHLGNERLDIIYDANSIDLLAITSQYDYDAFGDITWSNHINLNDKPNRLGYIGKEKDKENSLADHGVRKYDDGIGRFTSIDPLWEKYYSWSPYHYCRNNPVSYVDGNGMKLDYSNNPPQRAILAEKYVDMSIEYLKNNGCNSEAAIIEDLKDREDVTIYVEVNENGYNSIDDNIINPKIIWDPTAATINTDGGRQSPSISLLHESDHMQRFVNALIEYNNGNKQPLLNYYKDDKDGTDEQYDSREEKRVIEGSEKSATEQLEGESPRNDHKKSGWERVDDPTKIKK